MQKIKIRAAWAVTAVSAVVCIVAGFGGVWLQDAEAALLPNPPEIVVEAAAPELEAAKLYTEADVDMLARLIYTEARGVKSKTEQAAIVWCVLNRLDNPNRAMSNIAEVVTAPYQFAYNENTPVLDEFRALAADVLERWQREKQGETEIGRVLPPEYQYFEGDGKRNKFTSTWRSQKYWSWDLPSPYED